ncbi:MAG: sigma-70 family RNA polymerase sigma factor [Acutalibacteraceae bacterium]|nr:sigma-70 family RNA polymerase sigma factor [Acutalibacteraceae bacterium]
MKFFNYEKTVDYSDEELVSFINSGNDDVIHVLVNRYMPLINNKAREFSLSYGIDNDDLVQEGLIALYSAVKVYKDEVSLFSTFASVCIKRGLLSFCRSQNRKKDIPRDKLVYSDYDVEISEVKSPEAILIEKEESFILTEDIKRILSSLEYKVLIAFIEFNSYDVIAQRLGITVKSVNNTMCRVRKKIREIH